VTSTSVKVKRPIHSEYNIQVYSSGLVKWDITRHSVLKSGSSEHITVVKYVSAHCRIRVATGLVTARLRRRILETPRYGIVDVSSDVDADSYD
jgi:hypothetical protein